MARKQSEKELALESKIIEVAKRQNGYFSVTPRYRDYSKADACERLKKKKVFKQVGYGLYKSYKLTENK